jgi:putative ABC transport system permease protein
VGRRREFAVRTALGASAGRVARLVLLENLVLASIGGAAGVFAASFALEALRGTLAERLPRIAGVSLDARVLAFATVVTLLTGLLVALAPLSHVLRRNLYDPLRQGGASRVASSRRPR